ncbi:protein lethal(2)essential for life-like [Spodoptera litura]|uniref:Protein lethal(2)essential for life-like n=1 Tax=Spodoptera litura TaxID=69820 RepID=A0A9J7EWB3_SPOLT|nr:protein lethal(2)essential for life-like [Spodoptera litura]
MKSFTYFLSIAILLFGGARYFASAEEKCPQPQPKRGNRLFDQAFGLALTPDDFLTSMMSPWTLHDYFRPWRHLTQLTKDLGSTIKTDKDKFQVNLDVQHFSPEEISVKTADGYVVIEAKHEEKEDEHGYVSRQFVRRYALPEGTKSEEVISELSSDGILTVSAPRKVEPVKGERVVPITQTGPVRREAKESNEGKEDVQGSCQADQQSCSKA